MEKAHVWRGRSGPVGRFHAWVAILLSFALGVAALTGCERPPSLDDIRRQQNTGDMAGSIEPLRVLLAERPDDAEVLYLYGRALYVTASPTEAMWSLRVAMDDPEWLVPAGLTIAAGAYRTRNFTVALDAVERVLEAHPDNLDALLLRAQTHAARKLDYAQALADADRVLETQPDNISAMEPKILALLGLDRIDEAAATMEILGTAIRETQLSSEGLAWHCATMAIFAQDGGHLELARERWAGCLEEFPSSAEVVAKSIRFYDGVHEPDASVEVLRAALADAPHAIGYRMALADRLRARGQAEEAKQLLIEATAFDEPDLQITAWLGLVTHHQALEHYGEAAAASGRAVEVARSIGEPPPQLLMDHADALVMAGEFDAAIELAETMTVDAYRELVLGRARLQQGDPQAALEHFSEAFRIWPDNTIARYYAARAAEEIGDFDRAIEEYRYSIRLDPGATDARQRLAALRAAEGSPLLALHVLRTKANELPLDFEGELLSIRLFAWAGQREPLVVLMDRYRPRPALYARAVAAAAEGLEHRGGPTLSLRAIDGAAGIDLTAPGQIAALRTFVEIAARGGSAAEAVDRVERALDAHPENADLRALHGDALALAGASNERVSTAYAFALAAEPEQLEALVGLGELASSQSPEIAANFFARALAAAPDDRDARLGAARTARAAGRVDEAGEQLEALLRDAPFDVEVASTLLEVERARGADPATLASLTARVARFTPKTAGTQRGLAPPDSDPASSPMPPDEGP